MLSRLAERSIEEAYALRESIAHHHHLRVFRQVVQDNQTIRCRSRCPSCCFRPVTISPFEAFFLSRWLVAHGKLTTDLKKALRESADRQWKTSYEAWLMGLYPCPILDPSGNCLAYPERPLRCRTHYVTSHPHFCHPHRLGDETKMVPQEVAITEYQEAEWKLLGRLGIGVRHLPIGEAILLAEKVYQGDVGVETINRYVLEILELHQEKKG